MPNAIDRNLNDQLRTLCGTITAVHGELLSPRTDMLALAARFAHLTGTVLLASGGDLDCARHHILGVLPWLTLEARPDRVRLSSEDRSWSGQAGPFEVLQCCLRNLRLPDDLGSPPLAAGLLGYLAYDLKDCLETLPRTSVDELGLPSMLLYAPAALVVQDKQRGTTRLLITERNGDRRQADGVRRRFKALLESPPPRAGGWHTCGGPLSSNFNQPDYEHAVRRVIDYIAAGDVYQVNLSQRFATPFSGDGFDLFRHLFDSNPAPFFAFIQAGDHQIVSTSPERFLLREHDRVETRPIKGTRPRLTDPAQDRAMRKALTDSAKDDAELSMIVDLLRNDIGKVCRAGSVRVSEHKRVEAYRNVYHLVSIVEGRLDQGMDSVDLIQAAFPGGSITGCPKVRAMEVIDELETCRRHVYCGSIGYISFHDTLDLSIAIRTATLAGGTLRYSVGGGIVFDSDPVAEYEETLHKGRTLMAACRKGERPDPTPVVWHNGRLIPSLTACVPVDDLGLQYGYGFFETLRADGGQGSLLQDHIARFRKTWEALMPAPVPDLTWRTVIGQVLAANDLDKTCAAVKILATRGSRTEPPWDHNLLVSARPYIHRLSQTKGPGLALATYPQARQTPLAAHKTLNYLYYYLAGQWARQHESDEALILNPDGSVSETNTANLLLISGRRVLRPQSGAVLPGVMAEAVCRQLTAWEYRIEHKPVQLADLLESDQVLATNSLMGAVPVIAVDGHRRPDGGDLWQRLNKAIFTGPS
jgi:para-aminobenzoate synthetase component 1